MEARLRALLPRLRALLPAVPLLVGWVGFTFRTFASIGWRPFHGTDFETPVSPFYYFFTLVEPWNPLSLGSFRYESNLDLLYGLVALVSGDGLTAQLLLLTLGQLASYVGTYVLATRQFGFSRWAAAAGAFLFAFSPAYLAWFTLPYMLGLAVVPWYFLALFALLRELLGGEPDRLRLAFLTVSFAFVSSLLTSAYFQNATFLLLSSVLALVVVFAQERPPIDRGLLRSTAGVALGFAVCYLVSFSRVLFLLQFAGAQGAGAEFLTVPMVRSFYEEAHLLNVLTLSGGTPGNEQFAGMQGNPIGLLVPLAAFSGLFVSGRASLDRRVVGCYYYVLALALLSVGTAVAMRTLAAAGDPLVTNVLLAGFRRPERLLEVLAFFYAIGVAFSVDALGLLVGEYRPRLGPPVAREHVVPSLVVVVLVGSTLYTGLLTMPTSERLDQQITPRPDSFDDVEGFLETGPTRAYDSTYRYAVYPMYSPLYSYLRFNYPALLYADGYASPHVRETIRTGNELVAEGDEAATLVHSLASVGRVAVLPDEFATSEHQAWRLRGDVRRSGVSMFGDPSRYRAFFDSIDEYERAERGSLAVYRNEQAVERVYVATTVVEVADADAAGYRQAYAVLDRHQWPDGFVLVENESLEADRVRLSRFDRATAIRYEFENVTEADLDVNSSRGAVEVQNVVVWSEPFEQSFEDARRVVRNDGSGIEPLSMWVDLESASGDGSAEDVLALGLETDGMNASRLDYSLLTAGGEPVPAAVDVTQSSDGNGTRATVRVVPAESDYRYVRITGDVPPRGGITVHDTVNVRRVHDVQLDDPRIGEVGCENATLYSMTAYETTGSACRIESLYEFYSNRTSTRFLFAERSSTREWDVESSTVEWQSPDHVRVSATVDAAAVGDRLRIPVVFGNSYNDRWTLSPRVEGADVVDVTHERGNGFANRWVIHLDDVRADELEVTADVRIRRGYLLLYRLRTLGAMLVPVVALGLFLARNRRETSPPD